MNSKLIIIWKFSQTNSCSDQHCQHISASFFTILLLFCLFCSYWIPSNNTLPVMFRHLFHAYQQPLTLTVHFTLYASSVCKFNRHTVCTMLFLHVTSWNMPQHFLSPPQAHIHDNVSALQPCILKLDLSSDYLVLSFWLLQAVISECHRTIRLFLRETKQLITPTLASCFNYCFA